MLRVYFRCTCLVVVSSSICCAYCFCDSFYVFFRKVTSVSIDCFLAAVLVKYFPVYLCFQPFGCESYLESIVSYTWLRKYIALYVLRLTDFVGLSRSAGKLTKC